MTNPAPCSPSSEIGLSSSVSDRALSDRPSSIPLSTSFAAGGRILAPESLVRRIHLFSNFLESPLGPATIYSHLGLSGAMMGSRCPSRWHRGLGDQVLRGWLSCWSRYLGLGHWSRECWWRTSLPRNCLGSNFEHPLQLLLRSGSPAGTLHPRNSLPQLVPPGPVRLSPPPWPPLPFISPLPPASGSRPSPLLFLVP